jgi:hypothetical protein
LLHQTAEFVGFVVVADLSFCEAELVSETSQRLLVDFESEPVAFRCAIHGTVTRCPFKWMSCESSDTPDLNQILAEFDWLNQSSKTDASDKD